MNFQAVTYILVGSTFGLILRNLIKHYFKKQIGFYINHTSIVNITASLFLGILVAFNIFHENLLFLFYVGFLGCFSTFSSFIYQLFKLLHNRQYVLLILHYFEVLFLSFIFFSLGYFIILILKN